MTSHIQALDLQKIQEEVEQYFPLALPLTWEHPVKAYPFDQRRRQPPRDMGHLLYARRYFAVLTNLIGRKIWIFSLSPRPDFMTFHIGTRILVQIGRQMPFER